MHNWSHLENDECVHVLTAEPQQQHRACTFKFNLSLQPESCTGLTVRFHLICDRHTFKCFALLAQTSRLLV